MTQKKILLAVAIASTGMIFTTGCAKKSENASTRSSASPVVDQEAARAAILATGNSIIEQRFALLRSDALEKAKVGSAKQLEGIDEQEAAAVKVRDAAVQAKDNAKQIEAEETLSSLSEQRLVIDRALNHPAKSVVENRDGSKTTIPAGSLVTIEADYAKQVKDAKEAFGKLVTETFDGRKEDKKKGITKADPVAIVTPVMVNHEYQSEVAKAQAELNEAIAELSEEEALATKVAGAKDAQELTHFNTALAATEQFRNLIGRYRKWELSDAEAKGLSSERRAELADSFNKEYCASLAQLVIDSRISFSEFNSHKGGIAPSKCLDEKGCGSQTDGRVGSNAVQSVEKTIADMVALRKDEVQKNRIRNYLANEVKWAERSDVKAEIEAIITNLSSNSLGWETMADAICKQSTVESKTETKDVEVKSFDLKTNAFVTKTVKRPVTTTTNLSAQGVIDRALGKAGNYLGA